MSLAIVLLTACYQPPVYVVPTEPPTVTPVPANATALAAVVTGPSATQIAIGAATSIAASPITITNASVDPSDASNSAVTLFNTSQGPVDLSGWTLLVANYRVTLPTTQYMTVAAGNTVVLHLATSPSVATGKDIYVGLGSLDSTPRANPNQVVLFDKQGSVASVYPPS